MTPASSGPKTLTIVGLGLLGASLAEAAGMLPGTVTSDTDLIAELLMSELGNHDGPDDDGEHADFEAALLTVLPRLEGAFSLVLMDDQRVYAVRDPNGFRPLCLGRLDSGGWVVASESPALDVVGAHFVRELDPGELVVIDADAVRSNPAFPAERLDQFVAAHADAVVADGHGARVGVVADVDMQVGITRQQLGMLDGLEAQLVAGVGGVGDQLAQEDFLVRVQRVGHQVQDLGDFGLEGAGFGIRGHRGSPDCMAMDTRICARRRGFQACAGLGTG